MIKYQDVVQDRNGNAVVGATVRIIHPDGEGSVVTIYDSNGGTAIDQDINPLITNSDGEFSFWIDAGTTVDIAVTLTGYDTQTIEDVQIGEAAPVGPTWADVGGVFETTDELSLDVVTAQVVETNGLTAGSVIVTGRLLESVELDPPANIDPGDASLVTLTLSAPKTITFNSPATSGLVSFTLEVTNVGGARTITWPASVKWPSGTTPTPTTGVDVYTFYTRDNGTTWRGALVASYTS